MRVGVAIWLVAATVLAEPTVHSGAPPLRCRMSEGRPVVDGVLGEPCWRQADLATGFMLLERRGRATQQTECMVAYDAENLYVAFLCRESEPSSAGGACTIRDGPVWLDDCVEVFLDPRDEHRTYFHVIANRIGTQFEERGPSCPNPRSWQGPWNVAVRPVQAGWTAEIAIPFRSLGVEMPPPGTMWGFNANRQEYRLLERSSWAETVHSFHEPAEFGHILFVPPS
jgi:cellulose/xylan binding protein with CBM9 domain